MIKGLKNTYSNYTKFLGNCLKLHVKGQVNIINAAIGNANYLMETINTKDYIFIHINKNAGSSIARALGEEEQVHFSARTIMDFIGKSTFESKFSFAFVRNPWDRVVSQYHYRYQTNQTNLQENQLSFEEWVTEAYVLKNSNYHNHPLMFQPQLDWLTDHEGDSLVSFIGRYENLHEDFRVICDNLNKHNIQLPNKRKSDREKNYREYYNSNTKKVIAEKYQKDIEFFKYSF